MEAVTGISNIAEKHAPITLCKSRLTLENESVVIAINDNSWERDYETGTNDILKK